MAKHRQINFVPMQKKTAGKIPAVFIKKSAGIEAGRKSVCRSRCGQ
jgi:hypothetical protein